MSARLIFAGVGVLALLAGAAMWLGTRAPDSAVAIPSGASPAALYTASFVDLQGRPHSLGQFQGKVLVVNFWATWCAPCREEMPGFARLQERWAARNVQFVGLANDDRDKVRRFGDELRVNYPLWVGGPEVGELSKRLGNRLRVLPHTVIFDAQGRIIDSRVGAYPESELERKLLVISAKRG